MSRVQSIERAFAVLGALADGPIGVTEVAERVDLPKSTAARLLASLAREGVVEQVPGDTRYRLGPRLVTLAARIRPNRSLATLARPSLEDLAGEAGEAAGLSVPDGDLAHYIDQVGSPNPVSVRDWTGSRIPLHAVSSGQVLLAYAPPTFVQRYLGRPMERFTARTLVTADALLRADAGDPARRPHLGARGVRRGDLVGRGAGRRWRPARSSPRSTCTDRRTGSRRPVMPTRWRSSSSRAPRGSPRACARRGSRPQGPHRPRASAPTRPRSTSVRERPGRARPGASLATYSPAGYWAALGPGSRQMLARRTNGTITTLDKSLGCLRTCPVLTTWVDGQIGAWPGSTGHRAPPNA